MGTFLPILQILVCMHVLWWGVQGMTTESPEVIGARLVNGSRNSEGRVEVYYEAEGRWGSVCDNLWTIREASVLCKQLGYTGADEVVIAGQFGQGEGDVLLDMVQCTGDEENLFECTHSAIRTTACNHSEDVGVVCTSTGSVRLGDVTSFGKGRLEYQDEIQGWGTVCNQTWNQLESTVACNQLGFKPRGAYDAFPASGGDDLPIVLGGLRCYYQTRLDECERDDDWTPGSCTHAQDVGVQCKPPVGLTLTSVENFAGIPFVYYGRTWGSFCLDNWDINAARIFCINSGFQDAVIANTIGGTLIPPTTIVNTISCTGEEEYFTDCPQIEWAYQGECSQEAIPAVVCQVGQKSLSIVNPIPGYPEYGRVEVTVNNQLRGTICDSTLDQAAANVVCRDLGFKRGARRFFTIGGGADGGDIFDSVHCTGDEESFSDCRSELVPESRSDCDHTQDAGVECFAHDDTLIDFVSGAGSFEGVVHYRVEGRRALICDQTWTNNEAAVACRMQGYEGGTATNVVDLGPQDYTDIFQWDIVCDGDEERLEDCLVTKQNNPTSCAPNNIAQVRCGLIKNWDMRMTGSEYSEQGRVETYMDGEWVKVWVSPNAVFYDRIYDAFCQAMGYDTYSLYHYNGEEQMPFQGGSQDAGALCQLQPIDYYTFICRDHTEGTGNGAYSQTGIVCKPFDIVAYHPIRLVDINTNEINNQSGLLKIYHEGQWGNICENSDYSELVCSDLGYTDTTDATSLDTQTVGDGAMTWYSTTIVYGTCNTVFGCQHTAWGDPQSDCNPMAVRCVPGRASSLEGLTLSLIIMMVVVTVDLGFVGV